MPLQNILKMNRRSADPVIVNQPASVAKKSDNLPGYNEENLQEVVVKLENGPPWGFRLEGGSEFEEPLRIAKVSFYMYLRGFTYLVSKSTRHS